MVVDQERSLLESAGHTVEQCIAHNPTGVVNSVNALLRAPWNRAAAQRVVTAAQTFQPDVVHVHNTWFALSPAVISGLASAGFKVVVTLHNFRTACANGLLLRKGRVCDLCVGSHAGHAVLHRCYRDSALMSVPAALAIEVPRRRGVWARDVARFLVLDNDAIPDLVASGIPADRITVRPNFAADPGARTLPPSAADDVIYLGRLSPEKGPQVLMEAWRRATPAGLRLRFYGDGPLRGALEASAANGASLEGRLPRGDVAALLREARALVFPSTCREAGPLVPIEAAAAGLPIIMSNVVGMADQVASLRVRMDLCPGRPGGLGPPTWRSERGGQTQ